MYEVSSVLSIQKVNAFLQQGLILLQKLRTLLQNVCVILQKVRFPIIKSVCTKSANNFTLLKIMVRKRACASDSVSISGIRETLQRTTLHYKDLSSVYSL